MELKVEKEEENEFDIPDLRGPNVALAGNPGTGKTWCIATMVEAGLEVFVLFAEPGGEESLIDSLKKKNLPLDRVHWATVVPANPPWSALLDTAQKVSSMTYKSLTELKMGINKKDYTQYIDLIKLLANFKCQRTGEEFGAIDTWGNDRAFVLDGLSGINIMVSDLVTGSKPTKAPGEWGVAMDTEERLIYKLCSGTKCWFTLICHVDREVDELEGGSQIMMGGLGRKLPPKLPRFFAEVINTYKEKDKFYWSTVTRNYILKNRLLPISDRLEPSFKPLVDLWLKRYGITKEEWLKEMRGEG